MKQESKLAVQLKAKALGSQVSSQITQNKTKLLVSTICSLFFFFFFFTFGFLDILVPPQRPRHLCRLSAPQPL